MSTKEKVIQYLLSLDRTYANNILSVSVTRDKLSASNLQLTEEKFVNLLSILETEGYIGVNFSSARRDLKYYVTIYLHEPIINYFNHKKEARRIERNQWIQFWIPVSLSVIAIIISIVALTLGQ